MTSIDVGMASYQYGRFLRQSAMSVLDQFISSRYPNSLAPLVAAHAEASIPANLGVKVLGELAKKIMQEHHA